MATDPALLALAEMLKRKQRAIAHPGVTVAATPPQLPPFQIPGMNAQPTGTPPLAPAPSSAPPPAPMAAPATAPQMAPNLSPEAAVPSMPASAQVGPSMGTQDMASRILAMLKARDPQLPPQLAMGQSPQ